jgi:hypothetical protein
MPSHVKESFTAAIVVRSLLAALGVVWVVGLLVGWVVVRLVVGWLVSWDVVVAVDMKCFLFWFVGGAGTDALLSPQIRRVAGNG